MIRQLPRRVSSLLLGLAIAAYVGYFSWYTINRHNTLNSYAADLSLIDQPMWNTAQGPGSFMELTWGERQQPRLAEHFEPILIPLSLLFFIWDDVRILLVAQSVALAMGALPVFWLARAILLHAFPPTHRAETTPSAHWAALVFALAYLLFPHLQAANIADFHADPFVVAPLLFAVWYACQQRWGWMWLWAGLAMLTKETLPTLTAMLGLGLLLGPRLAPDIFPPKGRRQATIHGGLLLVVSTIWFFVATFLIVAPLARQHFGADGPIYLTNRFGQTTNWAALLTDPGRWRYLLGLLAAAGFLPLLAPEMLLLGLPVLAANLLSNFPGQYSGEQHYSAPLVAAFIVAAIFGLRRLLAYISLREQNKQSLRRSVLIAASLWLLAASLAYQALHGWTPLSLRTEQYSSTPAAALLPALAAQIPADAVVSASAGLHPHLAHRRIIYVFPTVQKANYLLVDVTDIPGVHPNDAHARLTAMLAANWQLLHAADGLILAQKTEQSQPAAGLPATFYTFAHAQVPPPNLVHLSFGDGRLRLLGYSLHDDVDDGVTLRFYWQTSGPLPNDLKLWPLIYDDAGQLLSNPTQVPMVAPVWYPPAAWPQNQRIVTETLPHHLPNLFHLGLAVGEGSPSFGDPARRWPPTTGIETDSLRLHPGRWAQLATFSRQGRFLRQYTPILTAVQLTPVETQFGLAIRLDAFRLSPISPQPGSQLAVTLRWSAEQPPAANYTIFLHLLAPDGSLVAQSDAYPTWLGIPQPTSQWLPHQPLLDRHTLELPSQLPPGSYRLHVGLYNAATMERLPLPSGETTFHLTNLTID